MSERNNSRISRKKAQRQLRMKRVLLTASLMVLVAVVSIGGTIAWLQDGTETITNTFAPTGIEISLTETIEDGIENKTFPLVPGKSYTKDPVVSVDGTETDVDVYLFVKFEEIGTPATYFDYDSTLDDTDSGWTKGNGTDIPANVWYREVKTTDTPKEWHLLATDSRTGKQIKVNEELEETGMPPEGTVQLKYTAYAIQTAGFENVKAAWDEVQDFVPPTT